MHKCVRWKCRTAAFPVNWKPPHFMEGVTGCGRHSSICGPSLSLSVCLSLPFLTSLSSLRSPLGWAATRLARLRPPHFFLRSLKVKEVGGRRTNSTFFFLNVLIHLFCRTQCGQIACFNFALQISVAAHFGIYSLVLIAFGMQLVTS